MVPATIEEDLLRREFTFNTLLWRLQDLASGPEKAEIIDLTGCGLRDLNNMTMRCPRDPDIVFSDDPTRMLRAIKFATKYGFQIPDDLAASIRKNADKMKSAPWEAIAGIFINNVLNEPTASSALRQMKSLGLLDVVAEMVQEQKPFASYLSKQLRDRNVSLLLDLMDLGLTNPSPLNYLTRDQQQRLREITTPMESGDADSFVAYLAKPPVDNGALISDFSLQGSSRSLPVQYAREVLLENPDLMGNQMALDSAIRDLFRSKGTQRQASGPCRSLASIWVSPRGRVHHNGGETHAYAAMEIINRDPSLLRQYNQSSQKEHEDIDWGMDSGPEADFLMEEGWIWVVASRAMKVYRRDGPSQKAWDTALGITVDCVLKGSISVDDDFWGWDNNWREQMWGSVGDVIERYASPALSERMWEGLMKRQAGDLSARWGRLVLGSEALPGGKAKGKKPSDFDPDELAAGIKVEHEHLVGDGYSKQEADDIAREIAMDHLSEIPDYYTRLDKMESEAGVKHARQKKAKTYLRIAMYDFDGTLFKSWEKTPDWWKGSEMDDGPYSFFVKPESLDEPCVPENPSSEYWISETVKDAQRDSRSREVMVVLITGRVAVHEPRIKELLGQKGIRPDAFYFNPGMNAASFKSGVLKSLLVGFNTVDRVDVYENENISTYESVLTRTAEAVRRDIEVVMHGFHEKPVPLSCGPEDFGIESRTASMFERWGRLLV